MNNSNSIIINDNNVINEIVNDIDLINDDMINLTNLIDKKCIEINEENELNNKRILHYKILIENIIIEYHKTCKELFKNE